MNDAPQLQAGEAAKRSQVRVHHSLRLMPNTERLDGVGNTYCTLTGHIFSSQTHLIGVRCAWRACRPEAENPGGKK